jgi:hypothetical protein
MYAKRFERFEIQGASMAASDGMSDKLDRIGGGLINVILGALILWVGQTTFKHAGFLASVDEKLSAVNQQFTDVDKRHESMRKWLESVVDDMKASTMSQFTAKDGDKLVSQVRQAEAITVDLERRLVERLGALDVRLVALETRQNGSQQQEVGVLRMEIAQLRAALSQSMLQPAVQEAGYPSPTRMAHGVPVYLPPVEPRR